MKYISIGLCILSILCLAGIHSGCSGGSDSNAQTTDDANIRVPVEVSIVRSGDIAAYFTGTATLEAEEETEVVAKIGGIVQKIVAEESDMVKANQVLAKLDVEKLTVQLQQAKANLQKLENEHQRSQELFKKNLISAEAFQRAKYEYEHQKATYDLAELDLQYTAIRAPISGVIAERLIKTGNMVLVNQPTFRVTGLDPLLAVLHVPERQINKLKVGQTANLHVDAIAREQIRGRIERISPVVDPSTGTVRVTVQVQNPTRILKPGMFARVHIVYDIHTNTLLIPKDALMSEDKESSVFVVRDSMAFRRYVEIGYVNTTELEISSGLDPGDIIVTTGMGSLKDSTKVEQLPAVIELTARK